MTDRALLIVGFLTLGVMVLLQGLMTWQVVRSAERIADLIIQTH